MRVSVTQDALVKALKIVLPAVATRSTMPILSNVLLEAKDNHLRLAATDRELSISCWLPAQIEKPFAATLPAKLFVDYVSSMPPERVDLKFTERTQTVEVRCASYSANINGIDAMDYPLIPLIEDYLKDQATSPTSFVIEPAGFRDALGVVLLAASKDESRPTLTGVNFDLFGDSVAMAGTDGYRLSVLRLMERGAGPDRSLIAPANFLREMGRAIGDIDTEHSFSIIATDTALVAGFHVKHVGRVEMAGSLLDVKYPEYKQIIPQAHDTRVIVDTAGLTRAVRVANLFSRDDAYRVHLCIKPELLQVSASGAEMGESQTEVEAQIEGEGLEIVFDGRYLMDILSQIKHPQLVLEFTKPTRPVRMFPVGVPKDDFIHVIMPMHPPQR